MARSRQSDRTLAALRHCVQTAVAGGPRDIDTLSLQALAADAERLLVAQAPQHVSLERELVQLRALVTDLSQAPAALHANLAAAWQWIATVHSQALE